MLGITSFICARLVIRRITLKRFQSGRWQRGLWCLTGIGLLRCSAIQSFRPRSSARTISASTAKRSVRFILYDEDDYPPSAWGNTT